MPGLRGGGGLVVTRGPSRLGRALGWVVAVTVVAAVVTAVLVPVVWAWAWALNQF